MDDRRCRFMAVPAALLLPPDVETALGRGLDDDDAILGRDDDPLFRDVVAPPCARFLFLITSVFSESGRTTPCSL